MRHGPMPKYIRTAQQDCHGVESCGKLFLLHERGKGSQISFRNFRTGTRAPFLIYGDIEALVNLKEAAPTRGQKTHHYEQHRPCTVGFKTNSYFSLVAETYRVIHGPDCVKKIIHRVINLEKKAIEDYNMTRSDSVTTGQEGIQSRNEVSILSRALRILPTAEWTR